MSGASAEPVAGPRSQRWVAGLLIAVGIGLYASLQVAGPLQALHGNDFKHIYLGMQALTDGGEPYSPQSLLLQAHRHDMGGASLNPYVYLPFTGLCLGFLKPLSFHAASLTWFFLNHVMVIAAAWIISRSIFRFHLDREQWASHAFGLLLIALALNHPLQRTLTAGQLNCVLLLCLAGGYLALASGRERLAGVVLGFAAMFKLAPGLFLLFFLLRRRWRALGAMALACAALLAVSVVAVGWRVHLEFLPMLRQMGYGHSTWEEWGATFWKDPANQSLNSLFTHLMVRGNGIAAPWVHWGQAAANGATIATALLLVAAFIAAAMRHVPDPWAEVRVPRAFERGNLTVQESALYMATILLSLLIPSLMWDHYLLLAVLPAAWLVRALAEARRPRALAAAVVLYALTAMPWRFDSPLFQAGGGVLLMSVKLLPALGLFGMCLGTKGLLSPAAPRLRGGEGINEMEAS